MSDQQLLRIMQRIGGLLFKRLNDDLDATDEMALEEWLDQQDPVRRQFFEEMTDWDQLQTALQTMYSFDLDSALADVQKKINAGNGGFVTARPETLQLLTPRVRSYRWLAAAAVLIFVIGGVLFLTQNKKKADIAILPVSERFKNDVVPGGDKAVLQLADGSSIVLDSAGNGELAKQGGTKVIKLDRGQLSYKESAHHPSAEVVSYNTISTPRGGQYQLILPDGSKVWLNAASSLKFPTSFPGHDRSVSLKGEAYFEIAKNASQPFTVSVDRANGQESLQVEVLGTEFDVNAYEDETGQRTTLINGAVKVKAADSALALKPGQQALIKYSNRSPLSLIPTISTDEVIAWKKGLFQFRDAPIQDIMRMAARWYDVDVVYKDNVDMPLTGTIRRQVNISTLLKILEATGWVHFRIEGKTITVSR